jgi:hypothetical protein
VTPKVRKALMGVIEAGTREVALDLSGLVYFDSSGWRFSSKTQDPFGANRPCGIVGMSRCAKFSI